MQTKKIRRAASAPAGLPPNVEAGQPFQPLVTLISTNRQVAAAT